jgi:SHS2 domain-containing protein
MGSLHRFIEHTADIAFNVQADSIRELFVESAKALRISSVGDIAGRVLSDREISLSAGSYEGLLVSFLNELNYFIIQKKWVAVIFQKFSCSQEFQLETTAKGFFIEDINLLKHEIKSVTYHQLKIEKVNGLYSVTVVLDI